MLATCDSKFRFIDIEIKDPGTTSDYLCFCTPELLQKLDKVGFLKPGLCIYGDNAFVNTTFMTTPFKGANGGIKDAYNFFFSQLRINIECAFGILVSRWGCLRRPIPMNTSIQKTTALVRCLCILQNYCINEELLKREEIFFVLYDLSLLRR